MLREVALSVVDRTLVRSINYVNRQIMTNVYKVLWERAAATSADYIEKHLPTALLFPNRVLHWEHSLVHASADGLFMEFGVWTGASINAIAARLPDKRIFGFDSFEGLKEDFPGTPFRKGSFGLGGMTPKVLPNVTLVKGWFDETVPKFLLQHPEPIAYLHLDADTYETTALILDLLQRRIRTGTVIVFDEYHGFPNWTNGEFKAWQEFLGKHNLSYRYLGFSLLQASIQVL
jgi:hypothetical protein